MKVKLLGTKALLSAVGVSLAMSIFAVGPARAAACGGTTLAEDGGLKGKYRQQFEKGEYEAAANCTLELSMNPDIVRLNGTIGGNGALSAVADRLPEEPLVVVPYDDIGKYGGVLRMISDASESGTSDALSVRHVNMLRVSDDLKTIVPFVAREWSWNDDYTELTFTLRKGHKWSDGAPFTAEDIAFWFNDIIMNKEMFPKGQSRWLFDGKEAHVEVVDPLHAKFIFPTPVPNIVNRFAVTWIQPYLPKHFFSQFHIKYNPKANELAKEKGLQSWVDLVNIYYNATEWHDAASPLLKGADTRVMPTLEPYILTEETTGGRHFAANPYFFMVDTAGQQLPYIGEMDEDYVPDAQARVLKIINGEVDYKSQSLSLSDYPLLKENEAKSANNVRLATTIGEGIYYAFNTTAKPEALRKVFNDVRFRKAMSVAINRAEIKELVYLDLGEPTQATPAAPGTVDFLTEENLRAYTQYDPEMAKSLLDEMGLKDGNGDGVRELPNGEPLVIQMLYANAGGPVKLHELVQGYWADVGVKVTIREVTSDEYRAKGSSNELLITTWHDSQRAGVNISQFYSMLAPPFGNPYQPGTGFEWVTWRESNGAQGIEPPDDVKRLWELGQKFILAPMGSSESNAIGHEIADLHTKNLFKIGVVDGAGSPVINSKKMGNFAPFSVVSDDYYFALPFRPQQWFFTAE
jgi:peptide/nickel transport system substrate-binding protein